jgi:hypothetical protein
VLANADPAISCRRARAPLSGPLATPPLTSASCHGSQETEAFKAEAEKADAASGYRLEPDDEESDDSSANSSDDSSKCVLQARGAPRVCAVQAYPVSLSLARRISSLKQCPHTPALARPHAASESDTPPGQRDKDFHLDLPDEENIKKNLVGDLAAQQRETEAEQEAAEEGVGATMVPAGEKDEDATAEVAGNTAERAAAGAGEQETSDPEEEAPAEGDKGSKGQSVQAPHMAANTVDNEGEEGGSEAARNGDTGSGPREHGAGVVAAPAPVRSQDSAGSDDKKGTGIAALLSWSEQDKAKTFDAEEGEEGEEGEDTKAGVEEDEAAAFISIGASGEGEDAPLRLKITDEPLPPLPAKAPVSPNAKFSLDSMLAQHSDFQLNRESEALRLEAETKAELNPAEILFQAKKLPSVRGAYKAPQMGAPRGPTAGGGAAAMLDSDDDDFESVMASVIPTPSKLEVADTSSSATTLGARALGKDPLRIAIIGAPRCGAITVARRLAVELCSAESQESGGGGEGVGCVGPDSALINARELESRDAPLGSPALLERVVAAIGDCPGASILVHYPRSAEEAELFQVRIAKDNFKFAALLVLEAPREDVLERMQVMVDKDGEEVQDADFDAEEALKEVVAREEACESVADSWNGCTKVSAGGTQEEVWARVALVMATYLPAVKAVPPPPCSEEGDVEAGGAESAPPSPFTSPEKQRVAVDTSAVKSEKSAKEKLKDKYLLTVEEEAKKKAEAAILAANPTAKRGKKQMSAALGISEAVVEEGEEEEEEEEEEELEIVEGDEEEAGEEAGAAAAAVAGAKAKSKQEEKEAADRLQLAAAERAWAQMEEKELVDMSEEFAQKQAQMVISAQSGQRRATKIEKLDFVLGFEEAWDFFKKLDREGTRSQIVLHGPPVGCFGNYYHDHYYVSLAYIIIIYH